MADKNVIIKDNYEEMSREAARIMRKTIEENPKAVIVFATGHSPQRAYRFLVEDIQKNAVDISGITVVKLDEWLGLPPEDEATCEYFIQKEIIEPLGISETQYLHFDSMAEDAEAECLRFRQAYEALPQIDLIILGIGKNGHLGLNEPAEELSAVAHVTDLSEKTKTHEMLTHTAESVLKGITMGIGELFRGKKVLLLADGKQKKEMLEYYLNDKVTTRVPVSLLKLHQNCICLVNQEDFM